MTQRLLLSSFCVALLAGALSGCAPLVIGGAAVGPARSQR